MTDAGARIATLDDLDEVTAIFSAAFAADPLWSWAIPDPERRARLWRFLVRSALRYPDTWIADGGTAAAMWIPPGGVEMTDEEEEQVPALLDELCGERAAGLRTHEFGLAPDRRAPLLPEPAHPPDHRGCGVGMGLPPSASRATSRCTTYRVQQPANTPRY